MVQKCREFVRVRGQEVHHEILVDAFHRGFERVLASRVGALEFGGPLGIDGIVEANAKPEGFRVPIVDDQRVVEYAAHVIGGNRSGHQVSVPSAW